MLVTTCPLDFRQAWHGSFLPARRLKRRKHEAAAAVARRHLQCRAFLGWHEHLLRARAKQQLLQQARRTAAAALERRAVAGWVAIARQGAQQRVRLEAVAEELARSFLERRVALGVGWWRQASVDGAQKRAKVGAWVLHV